MSLETEVNSVDMDDCDKTEESLTPSDWDARLAVARAKREKILAQKAAAPKKKRVNRPPVSFQFEDLENEKSAFFDEEQDTPNEEPPDVALAPVAPSPVVPEPDVPSPVIPEPVLREKPASERLFVPLAPPAVVPETRRIRNLGLVLVSCFVGLGLGFALGVGLLIGSGWITPQQIASFSTPSLQETTERTIAPVVTPTTTTPQVVQAPKPTVAAAVVNPVIVDTSPLVFFATTALQPVQPPPPISSFVQIASIQRSTIAPLPKQAKADLTLARYGLPETAKPTTFKGIFTPSPITWAEQAQPVLKPPSGETLYSHGGKAPLRLQTPAVAEVAFVAPNLVRSRGAVQADVQNLAPVQNLISVPNLPITNFALASFSRSPTGLPPAATSWQLPKADQPSIKLNFAQRMGLSIDEAKKFDLMLFAPETVKDTDMAGLSGTLSATGLPLSKTQKVNFTISERHIRYYSDESKSIAVALADSMGMEARDFISNGRGSDRIEVWMSGKSSVRPSVKTAKRRKFSPQTSTRTRLSNSIINGLRNANK
jgi:hypothetical protein